jgi:hypothetical protein
MSTLHAVLFFVGIPLLIIAVITLLVMAPSLAKGPRYRLTEQWDANAEWFGAPSAVEAAAEAPELEASKVGSEPPRADDSGGASASW